MPFGLYEVSGGTYTLLAGLSIDDIVVEPAKAHGLLLPTSSTATLDDQGCLPPGVWSTLGVPWHVAESQIIAVIATHRLSGSTPSSLSSLKVVVNITPARPTVHLAEIKGVWGYTYTHWRGHGQYWIPVMLKLQSLWLDVPRSSLGIRGGVGLPTPFSAPPKPGRVHFEFFYITEIIRKKERKVTVALGSFNHPLLSGEALAYFTCVMRNELMNEPRPCGGLDICGCDQC